MHKIHSSVKSPTDNEGSKIGINIWRGPANDNFVCSYKNYCFKAWWQMQQKFDSITQQKLLSSAQNNLANYSGVRLTHTRLTHKTRLPIRPNQSRQWYLPYNALCLTHNLLSKLKKISPFHYVLTRFHCIVLFPVLVAPNNIRNIYI